MGPSHLALIDALKGLITMRRKCKTLLLFHAVILVV